MHNIPPRATGHRRYPAVLMLCALTVPGTLTGCSSEESTPPAAVTEAAPDLTAPPADLRWRDYQGVQVPIGAEGPRADTEASATGFAHTPAGATLAAIVHTIRMSVAPDPHWASVAALELAPGPGKDDWAAARVLLSITGRADPATVPRLRGYTITHYDRATARVEIYTGFPDTSIAVNTATVAWIAGDWRLQLPDPASTDPTVRVTDTMDAAVALEAPR